MNQNRNNSQTIEEVCEFLNEQMQFFEQTSEVQRAIDNLMEAVTLYFNAEATLLYKKSEDRYTLASIWPDTDTPAEKEILYELLHQENHFAHSGVIHIKESQNDDMDDVTFCVKPLLDKENIIALLVVVNPSRNRVHLLDPVLDVMGNWLANRLVKRDYVNRDNRVQRLLSGLGNDYTAVYMINLDTDTFEIIINQTTNNVAKLPKHNGFSAYLDNYADTYVLEDSREEMKTVLRYGYLRKHFENNEDLYFRFHSVPNILGQTCFEAHAVRQYEYNGNFAVIGFRCVDRIVKKELDYQQKLDAAYQDAKRQLDIISASIPGGIKISFDDPKYTFKYVSKQYAAMLGYDNVEEFMEASGGSIVGVAHPDDVENGIAEALEQYSRGDSYAITYRMKCKDGTWKYIEDHGHKVINTRGETEHWNLILDKHELVEKTIELESEKRAGEAKTAFLSRMSHDIRTPLNGIIGLLEYGERHPDDMEALAENREKAHVAADHLLALVNDILEFNKLNDSSTNLVEEPFNFADLLHEVKTISDMRAAEESVTIHMEDSYLEIKNPYVIGSPLYVKQIFINVITNAIKYNRIGGSVWCRVEENQLKDGKVQFMVRITDNGIGMSEEFMEKMFDPFAQEKYDARSFYQGNGLGMPIVKSLVKKMDGTIEVDSKLDAGTQVEITLTFPKARHSQIPSQPAMEISYDLTGLKVLIVEDNELNMEIARCMLEDENMEVTEAGDGAQALEIFSENPPGTFDLILMDVMMPVMDGLTATRKIRQLDRPDAGKIPIFAMTANAFAEDVQTAKNAGMNEHIAKPIEMETLISKITQYCWKDLPQM